MSRAAYSSSSESQLGFPLLPHDVVPEVDHTVVVGIFIPEVIMVIVLGKVSQDHPRITFFVGPELDGTLGEQVGESGVEVVHVSFRSGINHGVAIVLLCVAVVAEEDDAECLVCIVIPVPHGSTVRLMAVIGNRGGGGSGTRRNVHRQ